VSDLFEYDTKLYPINTNPFNINIDEIEDEIKAVSKLKSVNPKAWTRCNMDNQLSEIKFEFENIKNNLIIDDNVRKATLNMIRYTLSRFKVYIKDKESGVKKGVIPTICKDLGKQLYARGMLLKCVYFRKNY
jgi:hypothetical protein